MSNFETITFQRKKADLLEDSLRKGRSFILFGPRQTGKSTLLEGIFSRLPQEKCLRYYFQLPSHREKIEEDPEILIREIDALSPLQPIYLYIDEIQKIPKVMDALQFLLDKKKILLAATGSSSRKMKNIGTNWLPGRVQIEHLTPLTWQETAYPTNRLQELLRYGSLPGILAEPDLNQREKNLTTYTHLYLEEEIRNEALVRNVPRFTKFLRLSALESRTAPNFSKIGSQVGLSHTSIREYFQILEDTLIMHRLPPFGSRRNSVLKGDKYYFFDIGVRNAAANIGHSEGILTLQIGTLFEHFVILEAMAHLKQQAQLSFWRSKDKNEVDLIIEEKDRLIAIEIKSTERPKLDDIEDLNAFAKKYKSHETYLVCRINQPQKFGSVLAIPWSEMIQRLKK